MRSDTTKTSREYQGFYSIDAHRVNYTSSRCLSSPRITKFSRLDEHGRTVTGQPLDSERAVLECHVNVPGPRCRRYGAEGVPHDTDTRPLTDTTFGHRPTILKIRARR